MYRVTVSDAFTGRVCETITTKDQHYANKVYEDRVACNRADYIVRLWRSTDDYFLVGEELLRWDYATNPEG